MSKRRSPLANLLAHFGRTASSMSWRVPCRDQSGRRTTVRIDLGDAGVLLHVTSSGPLEFKPLDLGRLRNALRDAVVAYSEIRSLDRGAQEAGDERRDRPAA